jgi:Tfp pilus assembly protein PilZ
MGENRSTTDRRRFSRVLFDAEALLSRAGMNHPTRLIDISLRGALVHKPDGCTLNTGDEVILTIALNESGQTIKMASRVVSMINGQMGLSCQEIDMESIAHLRRLVELNLGNETLLERELEALG